jgi:hypothetical protein
MSTTVRQLDLLPSLSEKKESPALLGSLERITSISRKKELFPKRYVFQFLQFQTMDEVHKPIDSECYTPSSEPLRF